MASVAVYDAFITALTGWSELPFFEENETFTTPGGETPSPFIYWELIGRANQEITLGVPRGNMWEEDGATDFYIMVPERTKTRQARVNATSLMNYFRKNAVGDLVIEEMSIGSGQPGREFPNYWGMVLSVIWRRQDYPPA